MKPAVVLFVAALPLAAQQGPAPADAAACRVCHPGAIRGLQQSAHAPLLQQLAAQLCTSCHGDLSAHAEAGGRPAQPLAIAKVTAAACAACHPGRDLQPVLGSHALRATGSGALPPPGNGDPVLTAVAAEERDAALQWSGLLELGYRFVHRDGSGAGYRTDVDLDPGVRLRAFELLGRGSDAAAVDELALRAHDLGDPRWDVTATAHKSAGFEVTSSYRVDRYRYRADGDYHRVDRDSQTARTDASVDLGADLRLFGSYTRSDDDGYWLTQRIGNRNLPQQTVVSGVDSPRHSSSDEGELGISGVAADWHWTLAGSYFDQRDTASWSFAQPATANPAFPESEDFTSGTTLRGPSARFALLRDFGPWSLDVSGRVVDHERQIHAAGTAAGYDLGPFTTATQATGSGHSRTWLLDADATLAITEALRLLADLHWRDHDEHMDLAQTDVSTYPTLASTVTVATLADNDTVQRLFDGALTLALAPSQDLDLSIGYGFAREQLRVPELQPADPQDFRRGHSSDNGVLAALRWRPAADWTLRAELRDFGQDGVPLHELAPEHARSTSGTLAWQHDGQNATAFVRHRRNDNDVSQHHLQSFATGLTAGVTQDALSLTAGYTFARTDSSTLTNFYFDPDPSPVPTTVGFHGDTHTLTGSLLATPFADWRAELSAAFTSTRGSFDVRTLDWKADLQWRATARGTAGVELRQLRYRDDGGLDDWRAELLFVYWRQEW